MSLSSSTTHAQMTVERQNSSGSHNPYTYISSQSRYSHGGDDASQESVDLLQMVPDSRGGGGSRISDTSTTTAMHQPYHPRLGVGLGGAGGAGGAGLITGSTATLPSNSKVHCTNSPRRSMRMVLLPSDTEGEEDSTNPLFHTCGHSCSRDSSIYYNRVGSGSGSGHHTPGSIGPGPGLGSATPNTTTCLQDNQTNEREDGTAYFDYLQFNKRGVSHAYSSHPSLYSHHKHVNCGEATKEYFKCCKKNTNNTQRSSSTSKLYAQFTKSFKRGKSDARTGTGSRTESDLDTAFSVAAQHKLKKHREWTRIKRLMFLVGILIGIVVALGGLVIGFLVITPKHTDMAAECSEGHVFCAGHGCVTWLELCGPHISHCPNLDLQQVCYNITLAANNYNVIHKFDEEHKRIVKPSVPKPEKDGMGWASFDSGSEKGSRYKVIDKKVTYLAGQEECLNLEGGHLAHINTVREQVFLEDFLTQEIQAGSISSDTSGFWLGGRRQRQSHSGTCMYQQWQWRDAYGRSKGEVAGFAAFVPGKPDNKYEPEECLYLTMDYGKDESSFLKWDDIVCDIQTIGNIKILCEVENR